MLEAVAVAVEVEVEVEVEEAIAWDQFRVPEIVVPRILIFKRPGAAKQIMPQRFVPQRTGA